MPFLPPPPSGPSPVPSVVTPGILNLGALKAMITRYHKQTEDDDLLTDAANDAIESLWRSILLVSLGQMLGGPITNLQIAAGAERATIVSLANPITPPTVQVTPIGALPQRTLSMAYTLVTDSGSETLISPATNMLVPVNNVIQVSAPTFVTGAIGWNCYGCLNDGRMALQNDQPLGFSTPFQEPIDVGISDSPNLPDPPTSNNTADNIFYIRLLQLQNSDGTWTTWQAGDLDGLLMERASKSIASTSTYQGYGYDVVNGSTLEIRPAAGTTLNPRYFYVVKPRRLRYDNAIIPFTNMATTEFLKAYAEALLDLSNHEYTGYQIKMKHADAVRLEILEGLNTQSTRKQQTITPYLNW
jgi:hypothetical protein